MNWLLVFISFLIVAFGQPAWVRGLGPLSASFGFALFWFAMLRFPTPRSRFLLSLLWFSSVQSIQLSWMATLDYMGPLIILVYLFLILGMGAQFALLSLFFKRPLTLYNTLAIAGSWTLLEWIRLYFLCGFTWNPVGLSLADSPYSLQFASLFGIFGLSFWVILSNLAALLALQHKTTKKIALWASLTFFPYLFGLAHQVLIEKLVPISNQIKIALVQTALAPEQKDRTAGLLDRFIPPLDQWDRVAPLLDPKEKVDLIVFPEAALPYGAHDAHYELRSLQNYFALDEMAPLRRPYAIFNRGLWKGSNAFLLQSLANQHNAHVIAGLDDSDFNRRYNAAFHFQPNNLPYERYEKRILAPVAEYVPLPNWRRFARFIATQFGIYSSFDPGVEAKVFKAQVPIGISICLEETFSGLTRELRLKGAELFVNLTNDAWFPRSKLPQQHFHHGRVRAIENGVPLIRACNTGITCAIDSFGRPIAELPPSESKAGVLYFTLPIRSYATLYTFWGDGAILLISALSFLLIFLKTEEKVALKESVR